MFDTINNINIYKVGKSINFCQRYKGYNYAEILMFISSDDITNDENEIIKLFNQNCKLNKGREFFIAQDDLFVKKLFLDYFTEKTNRSIAANIITKKILEEKILAKQLLKNKKLDKKILQEKIVVKEDSNNNIIYNTNCDKTCPTCKIVFKYSSRLKSHFQLTFHCKKTPDEIKNYFLNIKKQKSRCLMTYATSTNNIFKCEKCNSTYTFLHNLNRHKTHSKCATNTTNTNTTNIANIAITTTNTNSIKIIKNKIKK
jgi:hypothetical protein